MEEKVLDVLGTVNESLLTYEGENMLKEGVLDSFSIIRIIAGLEETFDVEIDASEVTEENFRNKDSIIKLMKRVTGE